MGWDFSQYNQVVKRVEAAADQLNELAEMMDGAGAAADDVANIQLRKVRRLVLTLDRAAIAMLAPYDQAAVDYLTSDLAIDPRRDVRRTFPGVEIKVRPNPGRELAGVVSLFADAVALDRLAAKKPRRKRRRKGATNG